MRKGGDTSTSDGRGPASERISRQVLDLIARDRLRAGDRLPPERELARLLGVSRPSVREAVRALQAQDLLTVRHGAGVFVAQSSPTATLRRALREERLDVAELFDMREVIELPAASWAAERATRTQLAALRRAHGELQAASRAEQADLSRLRVLDMAFHMRIVEAGGNSFLIRTLGVLQEILARSMQTTLELPGRLERSRTDHLRIYEAIAAHDPARARRAARAHITGARKAAVDRLHGNR